MRHALLSAIAGGAALLAIATACAPSAQTADAPSGDAPSAGAPAGGTPWIAIAGPDELVIPADRFGQCGRQGPARMVVDTPDSPPNLVRRADGRIMLTAGAGDNAPFFSRDGKTFTRDGCHSILPSAFNPDPAAFAYWAWLISFATHDGKDIFALVHNEYHGTEAIPQCRARLAPGGDTAGATCLQIALTGAISHDGGNSFHPLPFDMPLAADASTLTAASFGQFTRGGVRDPSNIVTNPADGYAYVLALADAGPGGQQRGTCVLRSRDPLTQPWFAWSGHGFDARMAGGYRGSGAACAIVRPWGIHTQALTYNTLRHTFIAIGQSDQRTIVAQASPDLVHWGPPIALRDNVMGNWYARSPTPRAPEQYFSLIDLASPSRTFDTSGPHPYLYYVRIPAVAGKLMWHAREIWRTRLTITP